MTIRQPPRYNNKPSDGDAGFDEDDTGGNLFREFPISAQTISGWSEIYPVAAELFDPAWLDLTEYWINFTNIVNAEPNVHPRGPTVTPSYVNGVRFLPLVITAPPEKDDEGGDTDIIGNNMDKKEDFQYVAFFDEDEKRRK